MWEFDWNCYNVCVWHSCFFACLNLISISLYLLWCSSIINYFPLNLPCLSYSKIWHFFSQFFHKELELADTWECGCINFLLQVKWGCMVCFYSGLSQSCVHIHRVAGIEYVLARCLVSTHCCLSSLSLCGATEKGIFGLLELVRPVANRFLLVSWSGFQPDLASRSFPVPCSLHGRLD